MEAINRAKSWLILEQRQNKNDSIQPKIIPILKLPRFFPHRLGGEKARQIQGWNYYRSYIVFALVKTIISLYLPLPIQNKHWLS